MRPFVQHAIPGTSAPQQNVGGTNNNNNNNNLLPNLMQIQPQMGFMNTPNFNTLQNNNQGFTPQNFGNVLGFPANGQLSNFNQGNPNPNPLFGNNNNNNGQFGWQNHHHHHHQLQNMNPQLGNLSLLNPAQINALTQLLGCANQVAQAIMPPQNAAAAFLGNPQLGGFGQLNGNNGGFHQNGFCQQLPPVASQPVLNVSVPASGHAASAHLQGQSSNFQGNHGQKHGTQMSNSSPHQNKNYGNQKREASNRWLQNSQGRQLQNPKGKHKFSNINEGKGIINGAPDNSANPPKSEKKRSLAMFYTEKEIQQWREARKKHYPSKSNVEKKLAQKQANADAADEAAKLRRQQLKDVLAKQVELGFEVPEIPSHYLLDPEHQTHGRDKYGRPLKKGRFQNNGRFQNKFNREAKFDRRDRFNKRGSENDKSFRKHDRFAKGQRVDDNESLKAPSSIKEPTLLQKLLSTDIKKDNSRLLQVFRFMVINSFFKDWPEKPLNFPNVIVKETGVENDGIEDQFCDIEGELGNEEGNNTSDHEKDGDNQNPQEEGEITD